MDSHINNFYIKLVFNKNLKNIFIKLVEIIIVNEILFKFIKNKNSFYSLKYMFIYIYRFINGFSKEHAYKLNIYLVDSVLKIQ